MASKTVVDDFFRRDLWSTVCFVVGAPGPGAQFSSDVSRNEGGADSCLISEVVG